MTRALKRVKGIVKSVNVVKGETRKGGGEADSNIIICEQKRWRREYLT